MASRGIDPDRNGGATGGGRGPRAACPGPGSGGAPPDLPPRYQACLRILEALPENRSGADKTWVEEALRAFREHYRRARRVR